MFNRTSYFKSICTTTSPSSIQCVNDTNLEFAINHGVGYSYKSYANSNWKEKDSSMV